MLCMLERRRRNAERVRFASRIVRWAHLVCFGDVILGINVPDIHSKSIMNHWIVRIELNKFNGCLT